MKRQTSIGIGELRVTALQDQVLCIHGLGSCVAVAAYVPGVGLAGLAHVQLPRPPERAEKDCAPFCGANRAIRELDRLIRLEVGGAKIHCCLVGGAAVTDMMGPFADIGRQNQLACMREVRRCGWRCMHFALGGEDWRTVWLHVDSGRIDIQTRSAEVDAYCMASGRFLDQPGLRRPTSVDEVVDALESIPFTPTKTSRLRNGEVTLDDVLAQLEWAN